MMNSNISSFLDDYAAIADPQYAVLLSGKWGCGKTYFINGWMEKYAKKHKEEDKNAIDLQPIYVSLYGLSSVAEITTAIDRALNPFFYSKTAEVVKGIAKIAGKVVFKTSLDLNGDKKDDASFSASLDSLSLFHSKDDIIKGVKFIVFDDIERCLIDMKVLLGYINYFVEHCGCHVVVIGDVDKLEERKKDFDDFKEKTVGREFEIKPDTAVAVDYFLNEEILDEYLKAQRDFIIRVFIATKTDNLRLLRQCLMDFKCELQKLETDTIEEDNLFLKSLLLNFIAVYAEYHQSDNHDLVEKWVEKYQFASISKEDGVRQKISGIQHKYSEFNEGVTYGAMYPYLVGQIVNHIKTGTNLTDWVTSEMADKKKSLRCWERLDGFQNMENEAFLALCDEVVEALANGDIKAPYQIGTTIGFLGYFDAIDVYHLSQDETDKISKFIGALPDKANALTELYAIRAGFFQGCNYVRINDVNAPLTSDFIKTFNDAFEIKSSELPDPMQILLRSINDDNVSKLIEMDDEPYPDHSSAYQLRAIFARENSSELFRSLENLSNEGRNTFCRFLGKHYMLGYGFNDMGERYAEDKSELSELKSMCDKKIASSDGLDKLSYKNLSECLGRAIKRCEGITEV